MRTGRRSAAAIAVIAVLALSAACSSSGDGDSTTGSSGAPSSPREAPIAGLSATDLLDRAQTSLPGSIRQDFEEPAPGWGRITKSAIGYPSEDGGTPNGSRPGIEISWVDDATVIFVSCADLVTAAVSPALEFCTGLDIPGVPAGGLESVWQQFTAGTWDVLQQPYPQITMSPTRFPATEPAGTPSWDFGIGGPKQVPLTASESSSP